ncbi:MAG TPA: nitroreductase [Firmicutes bacterium]|nr:nitroreductase [Bacillota bacterium]
MSFMELCKGRCSVRGYLPDPIPQEKIDYILECARHAPSAANRQPWRLYIVTGEAKKRLEAAYSKSWFAEAPLALAFVGNRRECWVHSDGTEYLMCDVAIFCDHLTLAAAEVGLGTCWIAAFDKTAARQALQLPEDEMPFYLSPLGFPKPDSTRAKSRKALADIVVWRQE